MTVTNNFFIWYFFGSVEAQAAGRWLGGWVLFLLLATAAVVWLLYDSGTRRLPALGWKMAVILTAMLLIPTVFYRFSLNNPLDPLTSPLSEYREEIFYLGLLGGILPVVLAIGYFVTYQGMLGCPRGMHEPYEKILGQCPQCARLDNPPVPMVIGAVAAGNRGGAGMRNGGGGDFSAAPAAPSKRKVQAWLVARNGKTYQLCEKETLIGRLAINDIYLAGDSTVSRQQAKIIEGNGHYKLLDMSGKGMTKVNGRTVREPVLLETDDEIRFGESTILQFKK